MDTTRTLISERNRRDPDCLAKRDDQGVKAPVQNAQSGSPMINPFLAPSLGVEIFVYKSDNCKVRVDVGLDRHMIRQVQRQTNGR